MIAEKGRQRSSSPYAPGATWGTVAAIVVIVAALAGSVGWWIGHPKAPTSDSVDVGFLQDMISHHDQAVEMATVALSKPGFDADAAGFAREILSFQRYEIGVMTAWLEDWGRTRGDPGREAMGWMGEAPVPVASMPGMQSKVRMTALANSTGTDTTGLFLDMMIVHHRGGIDMAVSAAKHATEKKVRDFADHIASVQRGEIVDMQHLQQRLHMTVT